MSFYELAGHAAFALIMVAYLVRDLFWLRCLSIVASFAGIAYNYFVPATPLWLVIYWNVAFVGVNAVQLEIMRREKRGVRFSEEEHDLYETLFRSFAPVEFMRLVRIGRWADASAGAVLTIQGEPVSDLILISNGRASVEAGGRCIAHLGPGEFVGEMSLVTGDLATATVRADEPVRYLAWPKAALDRLLTRYPSMRFAMQAVVSANLTRKLMRERERE
jgi:hypothetical protein